jgi:hypothetical protein
MDMQGIIEELSLSQEVLSAYEYITGRKVGPVLISGDPGAGKAALGMLLSLQAFSIIAYEPCPWGLMREAVRTIAVCTHSEDAQLALMQELLEKHLPIPAFPTELRVVTGKDAFGLNLCHVVFHHAALLSTGTHELSHLDCVLALERRVLSRTRLEPPARIVHIQTVGERGWLGRNPGIMVDKRGPQYGVMVMLGRANRGAVT